MKTLINIIALLIQVSLLYALTLFATLQPNPIKWNDLTRLIVSVIAGLLIIGFYGRKSKKLNDAYEINTMAEKIRDMVKDKK